MSAWAGGQTRPLNCSVPPGSTARSSPSICDSARLLVSIEAATFVPVASPFKGKVCHGVRIALTERRVLDAGLLGIEILSGLFRLYPGRVSTHKALSLIGSRTTLQAIREGKIPGTSSWQRSLDAFRQLRATYLLYTD